MEATDTTGTPGTLRPTRPQPPAPAGIDVETITRWLVAHIAGANPPLGFELIAGGRSNLTYRVTDATGHCWVLRRPPISHVLPTAHDMTREYRVITALAPTPVPVPETLGLCTDTSVTGAPFYLMEFIDGLIVRDEQTALTWLDEGGRRSAGESLADTLAALHAVDVDKIGLGDFAKREGYVDRQLRRWIQQFRSSAEPGSPVARGVESVHDRLAASVPVQSSVAIVHGDYRLDNTVLAPDGSVRAVLDWEICTLGDPLADLGMLMVYWAEPGERASLLGASATTLPGFPSRKEICDRYAAASGRDLSTLGYFTAFGYWKLACILQGVYARYAAGATAGDRSSVEEFLDHIAILIQAASDALEGQSSLGGQ
jgi:aminoglycoside phosphotransferase (APT) family kinase protein